MDKIPYPIRINRYLAMTGHGTRRVLEEAENPHHPVLERLRGTRQSSCADGLLRYARR